MLCVLRHRITGEIACGFRRNSYDLEYYGALWWEDKEAAEQESAEQLALSGHEHDSDWEIVEVGEERLKLFNVKVNNDKNRHIVLERDGKISIRKDIAPL
ncbi:hypothetical protein [Paenibacillus spongiae]|uniref:Uncharacterized protein n=1 Tax=Paenibacillus spongiae TaxID=2909671 RepID=A0ABY5S1A0_9BACL|nr:hypothetical protein [Paenibacillus spongiae]UVI27636.1 hypothetical protein L1F29_19410 [Paenibacillus spongiae]